MGGRGASSGISAQGLKYGTEFHSVLQVGNIKFVKYDQAVNEKSPMETRTKGRIYATITRNNEIKSITMYDRSGKRNAQIDVNGEPHKINGKPTLPHVHLGYFHTEYAETRGMNDYERGLVAKVKRLWKNRG